MTYLRIMSLKNKNNDANKVIKKYPKMKNISSEFYEGFGI